MTHPAPPCSSRSRIPARRWAAAIAWLAIACGTGAAADGAAADGTATAQSVPERCFAVAKAYADCLMKHGRDTVGKPSPLFASALHRTELRLLAAGEAKEIDDIRDSDQSLTGGNPMHDENLYRLLYALSDATGDASYAAEADKALGWFFPNTQHPASGFVAWGEHLFWDFTTEAVPPPKENRQFHEYYRPWLLWKESHRVAPKAVERYAKSVWLHQIGDHVTGAFSRHATYARAGKGGSGAEFPRHGGFYIRTWAEVYALSPTPDPDLLTAITVIADSFDKRSAETVATSKKKIVTWWTKSWLALVVHMHAGADALAGRADDPKATALAERLRTQATAIFGRIQQPGPEVNWSSGYGKHPGSSALLYATRYRQTKDEDFKAKTLAAADAYFVKHPTGILPPKEALLMPESFATAIFAMQEATALAPGEPRYLAYAHTLATMAMDIFFDGSPLPRATSKHDHYESITRGDSLALALFSLWLTTKKPDVAAPFEGIDH